jgi:hypothetical protein
MPQRRRRSNRRCCHKSLHRAREPAKLAAAVAAAERLEADREAALKPWRLTADAGDGFLPMRDAMRALGVSRQTVLQRVKRGELEAAHVMRGKPKGLRIKILA